MEQPIEVGPKLDEAVALKMGWRKGKSSTILGPGSEDSTYWYNREGYKTECRVTDIFAGKFAWSPSINIDEGWQVFQFVMDNYLFSKRRRFLHLLQEQARLEDGSLAAWPDVLVVLRKRFPEAICRAFLALE